LFRVVLSMTVVHNDVQRNMSRSLICMSVTFIFFLVCLVLVRLFMSILRADISAVHLPICPIGRAMKFTLNILA